MKQFVVDSLAKLGMAEDDYNGQKQAMEAIVGFAHEMGVHVHLVAHPRKADDETKLPGNSTFEVAQSSPTWPTT